MDASTMLLALVAALFGVLVAIFSWMGNKVYEKLNEITGLMRNIEKDLHERIGELDKRISLIEIKCTGYLNRDT